MKKYFKSAAYWIGVLILGVFIGVTIKYVAAWVEPGAMPPGGNIAAPLNTSNIGQTKIGGLTINTGGSTYGLIIQQGLVGIQTTTPLAELDVNGDIRAHNLSLNNNLNVGGNGYFGGNVNVNGDIWANNFRVNNTNNSLGPNGLCLGDGCKGNWSEVTGDLAAGAQWVWNCSGSLNCAYDLVAIDPKGNNEFLNDSCYCYYNGGNPPLLVNTINRVIMFGGAGLPMNYYYTNRTCAEVCSMAP